MPNIFAKKILKDRLNLENHDLSTWKRIIEENEDAYLVRMANGNMGSTQKRIEDLETAIEKLNVI